MLSQYQTDNKLLQNIGAVIDDEIPMEWTFWLSLITKVLHFQQFDACMSLPTEFTFN